MGISADPETAGRSDSLQPVVALAAFAFGVDALVMNVVFFSFLLVALQVLLGFPLSFMRRYKAERRRIYRSISVYSGTLALVVVMVLLNSYLAPLRAQRLIEAIEDYRAATNVYPEELDDLVPHFVDHIPRAQYTLTGVFFYSGGGASQPPMLMYIPYGMARRVYYFKSKQWLYLD